MHRLHMQQAVTSYAAWLDVEDLPAAPPTHPPPSRPASSSSSSSRPWSGTSYTNRTTGTSRPSSARSAIGLTVQQAHREQQQQQLGACWTKQSVWPAAHDSPHEPQLRPGTVIAHAAAAGGDAGPFQPLPHPYTAAGEPCAGSMLGGPAKRMHQCRW